jgi:hypothetical protein
MTVGQLKSRYREVFGEDSSSNRFRQYLQRNSDVNDVVLRTPARESLAVPAFVSDSPADQRIQPKNGTGPAPRLFRTPTLGQH